MAPTHGPLFDEFPARSHDPHGPQQDENYGAIAAANAGGSLDSLSPSYRENTADPMWDDRTWHQPSQGHGALLDSDFSQPAALDGDGKEHGTWFDQFRGGRPVTAIVEGMDVECVVIECKPDHVIAELKRGKNQGGGRVELALSQITGLAAATERATFGQNRKLTASPLEAGRGMEGVAEGQGPVDQRAGEAVAPPSTAHAPSAHSATASGGHLPSARKSIEDTLVDLRKIAE